VYHFLVRMSTIGGLLPDLSLVDGDAMALGVDAEVHGRFAASLLRLSSSPPFIIHHSSFLVSSRLVRRAKVVDRARAELLYL
jgi:hypothetical protein